MCDEGECSYPTLQVVARLELRVLQRLERVVRAGENPALTLRLLDKVRKLNQPYVYDEKHDQTAKCVCGHSYYRHFDGYDNNRPVGCKYCACHVFRAENEPTSSK